MKFRKPTTLVDAWRVSFAEAEPLWLELAVRDERAKLTRWRPRGAAFYVIKTLRGTFSAHAGDWIVATQDGDLDVWNDGLFRREFELVLPEAVR